MNSILIPMTFSLCHEIILFNVIHFLESILEAVGVVVIWVCPHINIPAATFWIYWSLCRLLSSLRQFSLQDWTLSDVIGVKLRPYLCMGLWILLCFIKDYEGELLGQSFLFFYLLTPPVSSDISTMSELTFSHSKLTFIIKQVNFICCLQVNLRQ